jgi:hypothetical protein
MKKIKGECEYCSKFINPKHYVCCYGKVFCSIVCLRKYEEREKGGKNESGNG